MPPVWRDGWALAVALAIVPALIAARGTPLGEPFADDFDFLHFSLLRGNPSWLDGGGGALYWRPLARQAYYGLLGPLMLGSPWAIATLHALAVALAGVLLYRALRPAWPAPAAAAAGSFPLLLESVRMLVAWPSCAQDLGVLLFGAAALHALSRGRRALSLVFVLAALLCKEIALAVALALPLWPAHAAARDPAGVGDRGRPAFASRAERLRTGFAVLVLSGAWWAAHEAVARSARLLPASAAAPAQAATTHLAERTLWAGGRVLRDAISVDVLAPPVRGAILTLTLLVVLGALGTAALTRAGRERLTQALPWLAWAVVWCAVSAAPLGTFYPAWANYRSIVPAVGLGIAVVALMRAAHPGWLVALALLRAIAVLVNPGAPRRLDTVWADRGAAFDFARLATIQSAKTTRGGIEHQMPKDRPVR